MADKLPDKTSTASALSAFLRNSEQLPVRADSSSKRRGRLLFALDATASRQPSWDRACELHAEMFNAATHDAGLEVQLCYYRGYREFHGSPWLEDAAALRRQMTAVQCLGGYTQIRSLLRHALDENRQQPVNAVVFIGDAVEEAVDQLCELAGQCGMHQLPLFVFQEGTDRDVRGVFQQLARLSGGAYAHFDGNSASQLAELLRAVATYASGGQDALRKLQTAAAQHLLTQL